MSTEQEVDSNGRELVGQEAGAIAVQRAWTRRWSRSFILAEKRLFLWLPP